MIPLATIDSYASQIVHRPVAIVCDSPATEGGDYRFDGIIHLAPGLCVAIRHADHANGDPTAAYAMYAVEHEAEHAALDSADEALVDCTTVSNRWQFVKLFRLPAKAATWAMQAMLAYHRSLPAPYQDDC